MKKNMAGIDRIIRIIVGIILLYLIYDRTLVLDSWQGMLAGVVAVIFLSTALLNSCPLYTLFGISTCPVKE
jgi:uncharacterized membrane protein